MLTVATMPINTRIRAIIVAMRTSTFILKTRWPNMTPVNNMNNIGMKVPGNVLNTVVITHANTEVIIINRLLDILGGDFLPYSLGAHML
jgi:hypothetical protein